MTTDPRVARRMNGKEREALRRVEAATPPAAGLVEAAQNIVGMCEDVKRDSWPADAAIPEIRKVAEQLVAALTASAAPSVGVVATLKAEIDAWREFGSKVGVGDEQPVIDLMKATDLALSSAPAAQQSGSKVTCEVGHSDSTTCEFGCGRKFPKPAAQQTAYDALLKYAKAEEAIRRFDETSTGYAQKEFLADLVSWGYSPSPAPYPLVGCRAWIESLRRQAMATVQTTQPPAPQDAAGEGVATKVNADLLNGCKGLLQLALLVGRMNELGEYRSSGQVLIHHDQIKECGEAVLAAQAAVAAAETPKAGGAL